MRNARTALQRVILAILVFSTAILTAQGKSPQEESAMVRNRAQDGLRGPVKSCREESTTAAVPNVHPEIRSESTTEYDREGRVSSIRNQWDSSYWIVRYEYAPSGRLLKIASGNDEKSLSVTSYIYDEQGHIQKIVTDRQSDKPVFFHYDQHGRKTSIETSTAEDYQPNLATDGGPFEALAHAPNLPGGGTATTIYDDQDRPSEIQVRDATGQLVMHAVRRYDAQGRVSEEGQVQDNVAAMFSPEAKEKLLQESGFSLEQLQREMQAGIAKLMGGESEAYSVHYRYDGDGRLTHTVRRIYSQEDEIETNYNDRGDVESEITRSRRLAKEAETTPDPRLPSTSEVRYGYQYDPQGNWIEKTASYGSSPDAAFQSSTVKRTLTYW